MNLANMMKQAQQVQKRLQDAQKELAAVEIKPIVFAPYFKITPLI